MRKEGNLFIISGPSGAGKGTVLKKLLTAYEGLSFSVSATTRPPRPGEREGRDYFFLSMGEFQSMISSDEFFEWARVHNYFYGTPKREVVRLLEAGQNVIMDIDTQGAKQVRDKEIEATFIFLAPPSIQELERRLIERGTEDRESLKLRLHNASLEMERIEWYDYLVINDDLKEALCELKAIIIAQGCRIPKG